MTSTPLRWVRAFLAEIPALAAEESLRRVSELQVGSGWMKRHEAETRLRAWERDARRGRSRSEGRATPLELAAMGITVVREPPRDGG